MTEENQPEPTELEHTDYDADVPNIDDLEPDYEAELVDEATEVEDGEL
jgi:hypothetical protein